MPNNRILRTLSFSIGLLVGPGLAGADELAADSYAPKQAGEWWQWALSLPVDQNPILDPDGRYCDLAQDGHTWYLAGTFGGEATRSCTIPRRTKILIPLINWIYLADPGEELTHAQMLAVLDDLVSRTCELHLLVDGEPVVADPFTLRLHTRRSFDVELPANNLAGREPGSYGPAAADGFYAMLPPLSPGEHLVEFGGATCDEHGAVEFETSLTYMLTVAGD